MHLTSTSLCTWHQPMRVTSSYMRDINLYAWHQLICVTSTYMRDINLYAWHQLICVTSTYMRDINLYAWHQLMPVTLTEARGINLCAWHQVMCTASFYERDINLCACRQLMCMASAYARDSTFFMCEDNYAVVRHNVHNWEQFQTPSYRWNCFCLCSAVPPDGRETMSLRETWEGTPVSERIRLRHQMPENAVVWQTPVQEKSMFLEMFSNCWITSACISSVLPRANCKEPIYVVDLCFYTVKNRIIIEVQVFAFKAFLKFLSSTFATSANLPRIRIDLLMLLCDHKFDLWTSSRELSIELKTVSRIWSLSSLIWFQINSRFIKTLLCFIIIFDSTDCRFARNLLTRQNAVTSLCYVLTIVILFLQ